MKILQVAHSFIPHTFAGTEVYTHALSGELAKQNAVFVFFRVKDPKKKEYAVTEGTCASACAGFKTFAVNYTFNQCRSFEETYQNKRIDEAFGRLLDTIKPDCVHIQHLLFLSLGIVREAKKRGISVVFTLNDYWLICHRGQLIRQDLGVCQRYEAVQCKECLLSQLSIRGNAMYFYNVLRKALPNTALQLVKRAYIKAVTSEKAKDHNLDSLLRKREEGVNEAIAKVDLFISPSRFMRQKFIEFGVAEHKIIHLPYGYASNPAPQRNILSPQLRFGFIGTLLPMKGLDCLLEAFRQTSSKDVELLIFGKMFPYAGYEGYMRSLKREAKKDKRIRLMGGFDHRELGSVFSRIDCLIVPSIWPENSPLVIAEAHLHKTPVVASRIGGIPELIEDGKNGLLVNPGDVQDLKNTLQRLIESPRLLEALRDAPPRIINIKGHAAEMEQVYVRLIEKSALTV